MVGVRWTTLDEPEVLGGLTLHVHRELTTFGASDKQVGDRRVAESQGHEVPSPSEFARHIELGRPLGPVFKTLFAHVALPTTG